MVPRYIDAVLEAASRSTPTSPCARTAARYSPRWPAGLRPGDRPEAMELGAARAKAHGVCVVGLAHSHHLGRIGQWAEQCIEHGLVSIHFVNVLSRPIVAPFGGRDARIGTNPFCVGIPRLGRDPIVLDFATSKIAQGKTRVAYNKGDRDRAGHADRRPRRADDEPALHRWSSRSARCCRSASTRAPGWR
jgi:uncharacterized oxidoreductase